MTMPSSQKIIRAFADNKQIANGARIIVQGRANMTLLPDMFLVKMYNVSEEDLEQIKKSKILSARGESGSSFCYGEIEDIYTHIESTNEVTEVTVADGKSFWGSVKNITIGSGAYVSSAIKSLLSGASMGSYLAPDFRLVRGQTFYGRVAESIHMLAQSVNARAFITHGALIVAEKGKAENIIRIDDSLILDDSKVSDGVRVLQTYVEGYAVGTLVILDRTRYRLVSQALDLDTMDGNWISSLILIDENKLTNAELGGG